MIKYKLRIRSFFIVMIITTFLVGCAGKWEAIKVNLGATMTKAMQLECINNPTKCGVELAIISAVTYVFPSDLSKAILSIDTRRSFKDADAIQAVSMTLTMMKKADKEFIAGFDQINKAVYLVKKGKKGCYRKKQQKYAKGISGVTAAINTTKKQFHKVKTGKCPLTKKGKKLLDQGMRKWQKGTIFQVYTTLGLRALPDKFMGDAGKQAVIRVAKTKKLGLSEKEVAGLPVSIISWLKNTYNIGILMYQIVGTDSKITGVNKRANEIVKRQAQKEAKKTAKKNGVSFLSISFYK